MNKKHLVLHHDDRSTDFLKPIYAHLSSKTVVHYSVDVDVRALIRSHERVIMLGHGYPGGLFYMIDESHAGLLRQKKDNIYIWCHADQYVKKHGLSGMTTGMFISETSEALCYGIGVKVCARGAVERSNDLFARLVAEKITADLPALHEHVMEGYQIQACPIIEYNRERLQLIEATAPQATLS
jgi:hypothetical protein